MAEPLVLAVGLFSWFPAFLCMVGTSGERAVLEGRSVTVPCHYEPQYAAYVKYWCQGRTREFCTSLVRTDDDADAAAAPSDDPAGRRVSIADDPVQQVSTVTMSRLTEADSGWYMCGVEIGGGWTADVVGTFVNINVIHGLSVVQNQVIGVEGGGVTVECLYSERLRASEKKWCRLGDWSSCRSTGPGGGGGGGGAYEDASVAVADDGAGTLAVALKRLRLGDAGWYWCAAGQKQIAVQVLVRPRPRPTAALATTPLASAPPDARQPPSNHIKAWSSRWPIDQPLVVLVCSSMLVLVAVATLGRFLWRRQKPPRLSPEQDLALRRVQTEKARMNTPLDVADLQAAHVY